MEGGFVHHVRIRHCIRSCYHLTFTNVSSTNKFEWKTEIQKESKTYVLCDLRVSFNLTHVPQNVFRDSCGSIKNPNLRCIATFIEGEVLVKETRKPRWLSTPT